MRVVVIGAGLAGLCAARQLQSAGHQVTVLDKGRSVGGRLATRRIGEARLDHGAQFFTVRSDSFAELIAPHQRDGLVVEWCRGFAGRVDGYPRYRVAGGMNALAKRLAEGLDVRCNTLAFSVRHSPQQWTVVDDTAAVFEAEALVVAVPVPQAIAVLVELRSQLPQELMSITYDPTLALMAVLDRPSALDDPGGLQDPDEHWSFVADNQRKQISPVPALTAHATAAISSQLADRSPEEAMPLLSQYLAPYLGSARIVQAQVKRWRLATPNTTWPERCIGVEVDGRPVVLAGDAYGGPKVEGAALSGLAAAQWLTS